MGESEYDKHFVKLANLEEEQGAVNSRGAETEEVCYPELHLATPTTAARHLQSTLARKQPLSPVYGKVRKTQFYSVPLSASQP